MSQYKITKARLAEIIKEEYDSVARDQEETEPKTEGCSDHEEHSPEDDSDDDEKHLVLGDLRGKSKTPHQTSRLPGNRTGDKKSKNLNKESIEVIRQIIQQELKDV